MEKPVLALQPFTPARPLIRGNQNPGYRPLHRELAFTYPWYVLTFLMRLSYGFRVEGREHLPRQGPFILVLNEYSPISFLVSGWISLVALFESLKRSPEAISYLREELFDTPFFQRALNGNAQGKYAGLTPQASGKLALSLIEGVRVLNENGIVLMNPEGDLPWDGRPLPLGHALAWLGLHSGAPIVPAIVTIGAYDTWPRWQSRPNLTGRFCLRFGEPLRLCDAPLDHVLDADIEAAERLIRSRLDALRYGPGGLAEWTGTPSRNGVPLPESFHLTPADAPARDVPSARQHVPLRKRGIALLLWRCPVCQTQDALRHTHLFLRSQAVECVACGARWRVRRIPGRDLRLQVVAGRPDLVGVEMALSSWYDEMKRDLAFAPLPASGIQLNPGEQVLLEAQAKLSTQRPNPIFEGWSEREAPRARPSSPGLPGQWGELGEGRLLLTTERFVWRSGPREVEFRWEHTFSIYLWLFNTLMLQYGGVLYRFELGEENGLKWLTCAGTQARRVAAATGQKLSLSSF